MLWGLFVAAAYPIKFASYVAAIADPPWQFDTFSDAGQAKSASQHYDTMSTPDIISLRDSLNLDWTFAPDSILLLWTTWSMLARGDAHAVMCGWGFKAISGGTWFKETKHGKDGFGNGYMFRDSCEPFLIGTRGTPGVPPKGRRNWRNGFRAKLREHSRKPDYLHRAMEAMYPSGPYLEMFSREPRDGWDAWGNETGKFSGET